MNRAAFRNFEQPMFLRFIQVASQFNFTVNAVEKTLLCFAVPAILGMNAEMLQANRDAPQVHAFALGVHSQRHRCAGAKTREQEFIRRWSGVCSEWRRLVCAPPMVA